MYEVDRRTTIGNNAANAFAKGYEAEINTNIPTLRKQKLEKDRKHQHMRSCRADITMSEMKHSIRKLKKKKSPGPGNITNEMLRHLGNSALYTLLDIVNLSWRQGQVSQ